MMAEKRDSERAFPNSAFQSGMSLRDWFAGQALASTDFTDSARTKVSIAYEIADAMIAARDTKEAEIELVRGANAILTTVVANLAVADVAAEGEDIVDIVHRFRSHRDAARKAIEQNSITLARAKEVMDR